MEDKHFQEMDIISSSKILSESTLDDYTFADVFFSRFNGSGIKRISLKAFHTKREQIITNEFFCDDCQLPDSPSNYNIWTVLSYMPSLYMLSLGLNVTQIPTNAIYRIDNKEENIYFLTIKSNNDLTIKSNAFYKQGKLHDLTFRQTKIIKIETLAFNKIGDLSVSFLITFTDVHLNGDVFQPESFGLTNRIYAIVLRSTDFNYIPQSSFKYALNNYKSSITFVNSTIDCDHCKNLWLIEEQKESQIKTPQCKGNPMKTLFDPEIQTELRNKCQ